MGFVTHHYPNDRGPSPNSRFLIKPHAVHLASDYGTQKKLSQCHVQG